MVSLRSVLPILSKRYSPPTERLRFVFTRKSVLDTTSVRYFFSRKKKAPETNVPMVFGGNESKTLIVVKPNSALFKRPKGPRKRWEYSPTKWLEDTIREAFPLKSIYRADMAQGMAELYEDINEQMNVQCFLSTFNMPNTMASWIKVCELHVFLLCVKFRPEEYLGKSAIGYLMLAYFKDVEYRSRRLAPSTTYHHRAELMRLKLHTKYIFMGYDEGIQDNDKVLAAAIWRRFFEFQCEDCTLIERLVKYIRAQLTHLHTIKFRDLIFYRQQLFLPLSEVTLEKSTALVPIHATKREKRKLYSSTLPWINEKTYN